MTTSGTGFRRDSLLPLIVLFALACSSSNDGAGQMGGPGTGGAASSQTGASGGANANPGAGGGSANRGGSAGMTDQTGSGGSGVMAGTGGSGAATGSGGSTAMNGSGGTSAATGSGGSPAASGSGGSGASSAGPSYDDAKRMIDDYAAAHPGQSGDVNAKSPAEIAADPDAQAILALCGPDQRPVIPQLAWEYGGGDHAWINASASALVLCVYIPVSPDSEHWQYDAAADNVTADVYVLYPDQNPCKDEQGADQVAKCIGDPTNFEILVDTASLNDGAEAGLSLSEASTDLMLIQPDGTNIALYHGT